MIELILAIAFLGFLVWVVLQIPMPEVFRNLIVGLVCFAAVIIVLQTVGLIHWHHLALP